MKMSTAPTSTRRITTTLHAAAKDLGCHTRVLARSWSSRRRLSTPGQSLGRMSSKSKHKWKRVMLWSLRSKVPCGTPRTSLWCSCKLPAYQRAHKARPRALERCIATPRAGSRVSRSAGDSGLTDTVTSLRSDLGVHGTAIRGRNSRREEAPQAGWRSAECRCAGRVARRACGVGVAPSIPWTVGSAVGGWVLGLLGAARCGLRAPCAARDLVRRESCASCGWDLTSHAYRLRLARRASHFASLGGLVFAWLLVCSWNRTCGLWTFWRGYAISYDAVS